MVLAAIEDSKLPETGVADFDTLKRRRVRLLAGSSTNGPAGAQ